MKLLHMVILLITWTHGHGQLLLYNYLSLWCHIVVFKSDAMCICEGISYIDFMLVFFIWGYFQAWWLVIARHNVSYEYDVICKHDLFYKVFMHMRSFMYWGYS